MNKNNIMDKNKISHPMKYQALLEQLTSNTN